MSMDTIWCSEPRSGNNKTTYLDELLHALANGGIVDVGLMLGGEVGELRLGDGLWIGGNVRGGHSGDDGGDATRVPRRADLVS